MLAILDPQWCTLFLKDFTLWEALTLEKLMKNCSLVGRAHVEEVHEGLSPIGGTPHRGRRRTTLLEEKAVTEPRPSVVMN